MNTVVKKPAGTRIECMSCQGRMSGICRDVPSGALHAIAASKYGDRRIRPGEDLFAPGDACDMIYNLVDGWVIRYNLLADGRRQILDFALPGSVLGFHGPAGSPIGHGAQALTDVVVCAIPLKALGRLCGQYPEVGLQLASAVAREQNLAFAHLTSIGRQSARERVAQLLLELFVRYRMRWPGHRVEEMRLPLTQEHIGDATGLTGVHVSRVLKDLKANGILTFSYQRLFILDPDGLVDAAGIEPELLKSWVRSPKSQSKTEPDRHWGSHRLSA